MVLRETSKKVPEISTGNSTKICFRGNLCGTFRGEVSLCWKVPRKFLGTFSKLPESSLIGILEAPLYATDAGLVTPGAQVSNRP
jgi:hypothetical protein